MNFKKTLTVLALSAAFFSAANADFGRVEMGVGSWDSKSSGALNYQDAAVPGAKGSYTSNEKSNSSVYVWALIKHPVPIIPNVRLEYSTLSDEGEADGEFADFKITGIATGNIDITQYDAALYYNILDNTFWTTLDVGLNVRFMDTEFLAKGTIDGIPNTDYTVSETLALPMGYVRARVEIPATNIGLEVDGKYVTYDGSTISDYRAKIDYTFDFVPVIQPAIEVGYRVQKFDLTYNDDQTNMDIEFAGIYAGLMLRF